MTVNHYATRAGKTYESDLMTYLRGKGLDVERLRLAGAEDEGDLLLRTPFRYVLEAKRTRGLDLAGWIGEAEDERDAYCAHRHVRPTEVGFVVVHKRRNFALGRSYVTTTLDEWLGQIR